MYGTDSKKQWMTVRKLDLPLFNAFWDLVKFQEPTPDATLSAGRGYAVG